ncbi:hypothetical protein SAMN05443668_102788 [Cryptosporangium aurantiacum]|uniref:Uncharacterized protein n=2 Tax=Cryptosporangium aurantiacum TaxID=134849 RepID=A0A1M7NQM4_9ACTN|nr:hypothetical protein SAMN05443668_102788 [Cryptosporangium aurantiacum]
MHESVYEIAGDDRRLIQLCRDALNRLAEGANEALREMATEVLRGDLDLRAAVNSDYYGAELGRAVESFRKYYHGLSPADRSELMEEGRSLAARLITSDAT